MTSWRYLDVKHQRLPPSGRRCSEVNIYISFKLSETAMLSGAEGVGGMRRVRSGGPPALFRSGRWPASAVVKVCFSVRLTFGRHSFFRSLPRHEPSCDVSGGATVVFVCRKFLFGNTFDERRSK